MMKIELMRKSVKGIPLWAVNMLCSTGYEYESKTDEIVGYAEITDNNLKSVCRDEGIPYYNQIAIPKGLEWDMSKIKDKVMYDETGTKKSV